MSTRLPPAAIERYERDGYYCPVRVLSAEEARSYRDRLERVERDLGGPLRGVYRIKPHLLFTWLAALVRHPAILDAVEDVIGPDILCWNTSFFTKEARSPGFVSWHQDATYWGLSEPDVVTAWVAFTESNPRNGNMRVVPGSHRAPVPHVDTFHPDNLLSRGQEITVEVDEARAADIILQPDLLARDEGHAGAPRHSALESSPALRRPQGNVEPERHEELAAHVFGGSDGR
jgi:non-heme Fe2+,alpha-ketoglutarate-dependent halogenase